MLKFIIAFLFAVLSTFKIDAHNDIWVETEQFQDKGGWVRDAQFIDIMGSQYLMAHGLGKIVSDATTTVTLPRVGRYYVWVRTKDWIPQYEGPGKFKIGINSKVLDATFGDNGKKGWLWEAGGAVDIESKNVCITLKDLTGFDGRCDVICLTTKNIAPSNDPNIIARDRAKASRQPLVKNGNFDLLVAGGGVAGICAAVQAARLGLKVALINNRPVLGGNSSSEIKVGMTGNTQISRYPTLGHIARQIDNFDAGTGGATALYKDDLRSDIVRREKNITLFENMNIYDTKVSRSMIKGVYAIDLLSLKINYFEANMFV
ncbi:MAG: FAD-dependent oxidoreductase, partial [Rikenellaceae bacterium]